MLGLHHDLGGTFHRDRHSFYLFRERFQTRTLSAPSRISEMMKEDRSLVARKLLHTTVFAQCFSPCGQYLVAGNNYGRIAVFKRYVLAQTKVFHYEVSLSIALSPSGSEATWRPIFTFQASEDGAIYSLASTETFLISAGNGPICAWRWTDILDKSPRLVWSLNIPKKGTFSNPEVNCMVIDKQESTTHLYAGCGDKNVYSWDLESGKQIQALDGHSDYIHDLALSNDGNVCATASEDGAVKIWDMRDSAEAMHLIEPHKNEEQINLTLVSKICNIQDLASLVVDCKSLTQLCSRPEHGKWIGCVDMETNDDWLVCGGGPRLSLWHLRSLTATTVFDTPKACQNTVMFYQDEIISAGSQPFVNHWFINGDQKSQVPCTPTSVFSVTVNTASESHKVLCAAGNNSKIDVCTNFGYKAFSLAFT